MAPEMVERRERMETKKEELREKETEKKALRKEKEKEMSHLRLEKNSITQEMKDLVSWCGRISAHGKPGPLLVRFPTNDALQC